MKIKHLVAILGCFLGAFQSEAQVIFSITEATVLNKPAIQLVPQVGLSYSLQTSLDGINWVPATGWAPGVTIDGKVTFVLLDSTKVGHYRAITTSNQVQYASSNKVTRFRVNIEILEGGDRRITVIGPTNLNYDIQATHDLTNWSTIIIGATSQLIFTDSSEFNFLSYRAVAPSG